MRLVVVRHVLTRFLANLAWLTVCGVALFAGLEVALRAPGNELGWEEVRWRLLDAIPALAGPLVFLALLVTLGAFHAERSLLALAGAGWRFRSLATWLLLACLPLAGLVLYLDANPLRPAVPEAAPVSGPVALAGGGVLWRLPGAKGRAAILLPAQRRLLIGSASSATQESPDHELRLLVEEDHSLELGAFESRLPVGSEWVGSALRAPRSSLWGSGAPRPDLATLQRWVMAEPMRADLRYARNARFQDGLRVLVFALLGLGAWLRPRPTGFLRASLFASGTAAALALGELLLAGPGSVGALDPDLAAFAPAALVASLAAWRVAVCDRLAP